MERNSVHRSLCIEGCQSDFAHHVLQGRLLDISGVSKQFRSELVRDKHNPDNLMSSFVQRYDKLVAY